MPASYEISQFPDYSVEAEKVEVTNPDIFCLLGETMRYLLPFGGESSGGWRSIREKGWGQKAKMLGSRSKIGLEFKGIICKNCRFPGLSPDIRALFGENEHGGTGTVGGGRLFLAAAK